MKNKKIYIVILFFIFSYSILAESKVCFKEETAIYCEKELIGHKSLNGNFYSKNQYFEFSARRSFSNKWCEDTLLKIVKVMQDGKFCLFFEEKLTENELTLNRATGANNSWSYFK